MTSRLIVFDFFMKGLRKNSKRLDQTAPKREIRPNSEI